MTMAHGLNTLRPSLIQCIFHEALVILNRNIGFCWIPRHLVDSLLSQGLLCQLSLKGNSHKRVMMSLVIPNRDVQGPAAELLEKIIIDTHLQHRGAQ